MLPLRFQFCMIKFVSPFDSIFVANTVKTRHLLDSTQHLKSGCPVSCVKTTKIKQATQFLISFLRNYQLYILNFAKFIGGDDSENKSMTFKSKEF